MRTTIIIEDAFKPRLKEFVAAKKLSQFVNNCLREHFELQERARRMQDLEKAYQRAAGKSGKPRDDFDVTEVEDWPQW
jgi:hypothetical protein